MTRKVESRIASVLRSRVWGPDDRGHPLDDQAGQAIGRYSWSSTSVASELLHLATELNHDPNFWCASAIEQNDVSDESKAMLKFIEDFD
jgi:hypothetical protein